MSVIDVDNLPLDGRIRHFMYQYAKGSHFVIPLQPFERQGTWSAVRCRMSRIRSGLEAPGEGVFAFAFSHALVNVCAGFDNGIVGNLHGLLKGIILEKGVMKAILSKIRYAGIDIVIPKDCLNAKKPFFQLLGALWFDADGTHKLLPWLIELLPPLIEEGMRVRAEYYESRGTEPEKEDRTQLTQDMMFFNALYDMYEKAQPVGPQNATAVVPAKTDDGVSMSSLEEALNADGGLLADCVSETDSDMEDVSVSGLETDETSSVASTVQTAYTLPLSALAEWETASVSSSTVEQFLESCRLTSATPAGEQRVKKMREAEDDGCLADVSNAETDDDDDATATATATPTRPRSKADSPFPTANASLSPLRAPLTARNLYLLEEPPPLRKDCPPSVKSDFFMKAFGPLEEGFTLCTEEEAYGLPSASTAIPGLEPAAEISEDDQALSPPRFTKKRRVSPNDSKSAYSRGSSVSYQATPPRPRW